VPAGAGRPYANGATGECPAGGRTQGARCSHRRGSRQVERFRKPASFHRARGLRNRRRGERKRRRQAEEGARDDHRPLPRWDV